MLTQELIQFLVETRQTFSSDLFIDKQAQTFDRKYRQRRLEESRHLINGIEIKRDFKHLQKPQEPWVQPQQVGQHHGRPAKG